MKHDRVEEALRANVGDLLAFFLRRTSSAEDAADLVAETLEAAWVVAQRMPWQEERARMWLFGVARNVLRHH